MPRLYEIKKGVYHTSDGKVITSKQLQDSYISRRKERKKSSGCALCWDVCNCKLYANP